MSDTQYDFRSAEPRWQAAWDAAACFRVEDVPTDGRPKYYVLEMFPYPSGKIHVGHVRNYTLGDVVARYKRARGFSVLHPMGWDAFGLPAENAARGRNIHPAIWTRLNIATMRDELKRMGLSIDWTREIATCEPEYYGHQQKLFLDMFRAGLVTRKESWVNWDPVDGTVLANEQVIDGRGWRSGAVIEKRQLSQWFMRITDYAEDLLAALDDLPRWPERVRTMQSRWIGRSEGARVRFQLHQPAPVPDVEVFTTRPDTLFGMSFVAVAAEHPIAQAIAAQNPAAATFVAECAALGTSEEAIETAEKRGFNTGLTVAHPFDPARSIPVWIANFVLMEYGTGAIFGCPAHDQRDLDGRRTGRRAIEHRLDGFVALIAEVLQLDREVSLEAPADRGRFGAGDLVGRFGLVVRTAICEEFFLVDRIGERCHHWRCHRELCLIASAVIDPVKIGHVAGILGSAHFYPVMDSEIDADFWVDGWVQDPRCGIPSRSRVLDHGSRSPRCATICLRHFIGNNAA